jgi:dihydrofolate synthase/folylpolyglutamate synthase
MLDAPQTAIVETPDLSEDQVKAMEGHQLEPLPDDDMSDDGGW